MTLVSIWFDLDTTQAAIVPADQSGKQRDADDVVVIREEHRVTMHKSLKKAEMKLWKIAHAATLELRRTQTVGRTSRSEIVLGKACTALHFLTLIYIVPMLV